MLYILNVHLEILTKTFKTLKEYFLKFRLPDNVK